MANYALVVLSALILLAGFIVPGIADDSISGRAWECGPASTWSRDEREACAQIPEAEFGFPLARDLADSGELLIQIGLVLFIASLGLVLRQRRMERVLAGD